MNLDTLPEMGKGSCLMPCDPRQALVIIFYIKGGHMRPCLPCSLRPKHRMQEMFTLTSLALSTRFCQTEGISSEPCFYLDMVISPAKKGPHRRPEFPPICLSGFPAQYPLLKSPATWRQQLNTVISHLAGRGFCYWGQRVF